MKKEEMKIVCTYSDKENIADIIDALFCRYVNSAVTDEYKIIQEREKNNICTGE